MAGKQFVVAPESSADRNTGDCVVAGVDGDFKIEVGARLEKFTSLGLLGVLHSSDTCLLNVTFFAWCSMSIVCL